MSKIISARESESCERWRLPDVGAGVEQDAGSATGAPLTAGRMEEIHRQAYEEGLALGKREGLEHGRAQVQEQLKHIEAIAGYLAGPLSELDNQLVDEVVELAMTIARHIIRREIKTDPGQVVAVVREAMGQLPVASRHVRIHVHPEDAVLLRDGLVLNDGSDSGWELVEDPGLARGGCRIETETSRVDATLERRLGSIVAEMLGGEREGEVDDGRP